jgi:hypothetical protein
MQGNMSKKLNQCVRKVGNMLETFGMTNLSLEAFSNICSQSIKRSRDPLKPEILPAIEMRVVKARESALATVQHYNSPMAVFKSDTFIILMIIAYTALFHALCERDGEDYIEKKSDGTIKKTRTGEPLLWDALRAANHFSNYVSEPFKKNLEFMIQLRDKIEHRCVPQIDSEISGHCQSLLFNFENLLVQEFTSYYSLNTSLCPPLHFSNRRSEETVRAMRSFQCEEYDDLSKFVKEYHASLHDNIIEDVEFAFRVFLIQMTANNARKSDKAIQFIPLSQCTSELLAELDKDIIATKTITREVRNTVLIKPSTVCSRVSQATGNKFSLNAHANAWKKHEVRPPADASDKSATKTQYCIFDAAHKDYLYTEAWVKLLISEQCGTIEV